MEPPKRFVLFPHVFYTKNSKNELLLYNTKTGAYIESDSCICRELIDEVYEPANLGSIELKGRYSINTDVNRFINIVIENNFGKVFETTQDMPKIVNLLPILNLQDDIDHLKKMNASYVVENSLCYLNELNIYLNNSCELNCPHCSTYFKQTQSCAKDPNNTFIHINNVKELLDSLIFSSLKKINFFGGNILLYPYLKELLNLLKDYDFDFTFWFNIENLIGANIDTKTNVVVTIKFPTDTDALIRYVTDNENMTYHFLIEDETQFNVSKLIIDETGITDFQIIPIYTGKNITFFENNIFLTKDDIFASPVEHRVIFCHQKLNTNDFGKLYVLSNGDIKANINAPTLGNIYKNTILDAASLELDQNTAWRVIRDGSPCNECLYQYLCPSPSNYEIAIGKPNLCHCINTD